MDKMTEAMVEDIDGSVGDTSCTLLLSSQNMLAPDSLLAIISVAGVASYLSLWVLNYG